MTVTREEGDDWPDVPLMPYSGRHIRPDRIRAVYNSTTDYPTIYVSGSRIISGSRGPTQRQNRQYTRDKLPGWVAALIDAVTDRPGWTIDQDKERQRQ